MSDVKLPANDDFTSMSLGHLYAVVDDGGDVYGIDLVFDDKSVTNPIAASKALDLLREALGDSWWVANIVGGVGLKD